MFLFYFLLFFSCFVTFSILEVEGAGGERIERRTKKIYKEYMIALARSLEKPAKKIGKVKRENDFSQEPILLN